MEVILVLTNDKKKPINTEASLEGPAVPALASTKSW